jgi:cytochrome c oxidase subunit II
MKLFGWALALAAAAMVPTAALAQSDINRGTTDVSNQNPNQAEPIPVGAEPPSASSQTASAQPGETAPTAQAEAPVAGTTGHMVPTPGIGIPDGRMGLQEQVTPIGKEAATFHDVWLLTLCVIISAFVLVVLLWTLVRYNRRANPSPSRNSHNTVLEVVWTLVPVLILVAIAIPSIRLIANQYSPPKADVTIKVTGHQWYWTYEYPDMGVSFDSYMLKEADDPTRQPTQRARTDADGPPLLAVDRRIVIPAGKVVKFLITADDVIHSFAVPAFWIKQDANPGQVHETWAKVDRPGVYFGQCMELCGARHAYMPIAVEVVPEAQFNAWVAAQGGSLPGSKPAGSEVATAAAASASAQAAQANAGTPPAAGTTAPTTNQAATAN